MDFHSAMETFAEAWMAANTKIRPDINETQQREDSTERANGRSIEDEINQPINRLANGSSPTDQLPLSLVRDALTSPRLTINNNNTASSDGKAQIAVHVVIERVPICRSDISIDVESPRSRVEFDRITLVPAHLRFSDLFQVVLAKTGFLDDLPYARAFLQLRNWRPLPVEQIPETEAKTVSEVLADISPIATLYVRLYSSTRVKRTRDTKDRLLGFLVTHPQCQHMLISAGCPLDENSLFSLLRGNGDISEETARQIESWWTLQVAQASRPPPSVAHVLNQSHGIHPQPPSHTLDKISMEPIHPALQQQNHSSHYGCHKTRMRTSFDPEYELPRLHRWFNENSRPARIQVQRYLAELNALESRRGRKPLESNSIVYWFKNQRAATKRHEFRSLNGMKSPLLDEVSVSDNEDNSDSYLHTNQTLNSSSRSPSPGRNSHDILVSPSNQVPSEIESTSKLLNQSQSEVEPDIIVKDEDDSKDVPRLPSSSPRNQVPSSGNGSLHDTTSNAGGEQDQVMESDIDLSEDEEDCRSRECIPTLDIKPWGSSSPVISPGALSMPPYPSIPGLVQPGAVDRLPYSVMSGPLFQHSMMYMAQYMPQVPPFSGGLNTSGLPEERRKRNRTFIDPVTEVPRLEQWFALNTHPSHNIILKYTDELNRMPYRQKFPKLEPKNIQFWFKNRRAKCKRLRVSM